MCLTLIHPHIIQMTHLPWITASPLPLKTTRAMRLAYCVLAVRYTVGNLNK